MINKAIWLIRTLTHPLSKSVSRFPLSFGSRLADVFLNLWLNIIVHRGCLPSQRMSSLHHHLVFFFEWQLLRKFLFFSLSLLTLTAPDIAKTRWWVDRSYWIGFLCLSLFREDISNCVCHGFRLVWVTQRRKRGPSLSPSRITAELTFTTCTDWSDYETRRRLETALFLSHSNSNMMQVERWT